MYNKYKIILIIIIIIFCIYNTNYKKTNIKWYRRYNCIYDFNNSIRLFFDKNNISYNISDWDIYLPCNYNNAKYEISKIPIRKNSKYFDFKYGAQIYLKIYNSLI